LAANKIKNLSLGVARPRLRHSSGHRKACNEEGSDADQFGTMGLGSL